MFLFIHPAFPYFKVYADVVVTPCRSFRRAMSVRNGFPVLLRPNFIQDPEVLAAIDSIEMHDNCLVIMFDHEINGLHGIYYEEVVSLLLDV